VYEEFVLRTGDLQPIYAYAYYVRLLTVDAWRVPVICGKLPRVPDAAATASEKGVYALFLFLLFKPYRSIEDLVESLLPADVTVGTVDDAWLQIYEGFLRWRRNLDEVASSCKDAACTHGSSSPPFDSVEWWSCMTSEKYGITMFFSQFIPTRLFKHRRI
jgi:hypothetical protein